MHFLRLLVLRNRKKSFEKVRSVRFITFRRFFPDGGAGGGGAVQSANRVLFGSELNGVSLKYSFYEDNRFSTDRKNELWDLFGAVEFVRLKTKDDRETAYITHDYGSAFGLYLAGKKYVLVSHIQGARIEEKINFGEKFTLCPERLFRPVKNLHLLMLCACVFRLRELMTILPAAAIRLFGPANLKKAVFCIIHCMRRETCCRFLALHRMIAVQLFCR